jgi:hypothetical protein
MDFAPDELLSAIQGTAQRVAQDQRAATPAERERVGREGALHAGLLELLVGADPDEAARPHRVRAGPPHAGADRNRPRAVGLGAERGPERGPRGLAGRSPARGATEPRWPCRSTSSSPAEMAGTCPVGHPTRSPMQAGAWSLQAGQAGTRTSVGVDGADIGLFVAARELGPAATGTRPRAWPSPASPPSPPAWPSAPPAPPPSTPSCASSSATPSPTSRPSSSCSPTARPAPRPPGSWPWPAAGQPDLPAAARALSCAAAAARARRRRGRPGPRRRRLHPRLPRRGPPPRRQPPPASRHPPLHRHRPPTLRPSPRLASASKRAERCTSRSVASPQKPRVRRVQRSRPPASARPQTSPWRARGVLGSGAWGAPGSKRSA